LIDKQRIAFLAAASIDAIRTKPALAESDGAKSTQEPPASITDRFCAIVRVKKATRFSRFTSND
jgi:hypothetical protein